eukprot:scaffold79253_cov51-Phaeocystis_antarctica.AAC.2
MGADTKANTRELVRAPGGLLERLQCRVALDALGESGSSFGTEVVVSQTASTGAEASAGDHRLLEDGSECGGTLGPDVIALETARDAGGGALQVGDLRLVEDGSQRSGALVFDEVVFETASEG